MGLNIAVTGNYGVGSSAVLDLLCEYSCNGTIVKDMPGGYEHTTLYHPGGLFDLEDKLLVGNDAMRSDEALKTFEKEMYRLNNNNFGWFGSFRKLFGNAFELNMKEFMESLHPFHTEKKYYGQYKRVIFNPLKIPIQVAAKILLGRNIYKWGRQYIYSSMHPKMRVAFPTEKEYYAAARKFVENYMAMYKENGKENTLFDRLLLCHDVYRMPRYFDENFRLIIVRRDVRDVFALNKYIWRQMERINLGSMLPTRNVEEFIDYWRRISDYENRKKIEDNRILTIHFEDMVYHYDDALKKIEEHCDLNKKFHVDIKKYFNPERSMKNTQVYRIKSIPQREIELIEKELPEYCYDFPYENRTDLKEMFDDSRA